MMQNKRGRRVGSDFYLEQVEEWWCPLLGQKVSQPVLFY